MPPRSKGDPTVSEVKRAHERASGGKKDRCNKGTSCGAACIHANDRCLQEFPAPISEAVRSVSKVLSNRLERGEISEEESEKVIKSLKDLEPSQIKAFDSFKRMVESGKVTEAEKEAVANLIVSSISVPGQDRKAVRLMPYDDIEAVLKPGRLEALEKAYTNSFGPDGKFDPSRPGAMGSLIDKHLINTISDEVAEVAYMMLPSKARGALNKAGSPPVGGAYGGTDEKGNPIFVEGPNRNRGVFMAKRFMEQGGIDPYTGKRIDIFNAEPEHMVANAHAERGKGGGGADQPRNLLWSSPQTNNQKAGSDDDFVKWGQTLKTYQSLGRDGYNEKYYNPALQSSEASKGKKAAAPTELAKALASTSLGERVESLRRLAAAYGEEVRYLIRASGVEWQYSKRDLDYRKKSRPGKMDEGVPPVIKGKTKPSTAILIALAAVDPNRRDQLLKELDRLRKARVLTDSEAQSVMGDAGARNALQTQKSVEYGQNLGSLLESFVPNIASLL